MVTRKPLDLHREGPTKNCGRRNAEGARFEATEPAFKRRRANVVPRATTSSIVRGSSKLQNGASVQHGGSDLHSAKKNTASKLLQATWAVNRLVGAAFCAAWPRCPLYRKSRHRRDDTRFVAGHSVANQRRPLCTSRRGGKCTPVCAVRMSR